MGLTESVKRQTSVCLALRALFPPLLILLATRLIERRRAIKPPVSVSLTHTHNRNDEIEAQLKQDRQMSK